MKRCPQCGEYKDSDAFYLNGQRNGKQRRKSRCADCLRPGLVAAANVRARRLRIEALEHYGGTPPTCACCGERHVEFLAIDHINGGGGKHREEVVGSAHNAICFYRWLQRNGWPDGFRVLCFNCNFSMGAYGYCPHQADIDPPSPAIHPTVAANHNAKSTGETNGL